MLKTAGFSFFILFIFLSCNIATAQSYDVVFSWTNPNAKAVNINIYEVSAPPDTSFVICKVNSRDINHCVNDCSYTEKLPATDKKHYFRLQAFYSLDLVSPLSAVASCYLLKRPLAPVKVMIQFK